MHALSGWAFGPLLTLAVVAAIAMLRIIGRKQDNISPGAAPDGAGERIAVRGLYRRNGMFGGQSHNSLNPIFAIGVDALHFRIFRTDSWRFAEIAQVDVRKAILGAHVLFLGPGNSKLLAVAVSDMAAAKALLQKLPRSLPISGDAAILRDGSSDAATPGLPRYNGLIR